MTSKAKSWETFPFMAGSLSTLTLGMFLLRIQMACYKKPKVHVEATCRPPSQQPASSASHASELVWTFSPAESSDDSYPSLHSIIATWEPPKRGLPSWAQSTHRTIKDDKVPISLTNVLDEPIKTNFIKSWPLSTCLLNILCNKTGVIRLSQEKGLFAIVWVAS